MAGKEIRTQVPQGRQRGQDVEHEIDHLNGILYLDRLVDPSSIWELSGIESETSHSKDEETSLSPI